MKINTKNQYQAAKGDQIYLEYDKEMMNTIYHFLHDIGAKHEIPDSKKQIQEYLIRWHQTMMDCSHFPENVDFHKVYPKFMSDMLNNRVDRKGNNLQAMVRAFQNWVDQNGGKSSLWPEEAKTFKVFSPGLNPDSVQWVEGLPLEKQPDELIIDQHYKITTMMSDDDKRAWLKQIEANGGRGYIAKVMQEIKKRDLIAKQTT